MREIIIDGVEYELLPKRKEVKDEFEYSIFKKSLNASRIMKFTSLNEGVVVWGLGLVKVCIGRKYEDETAHTDITNWEDVPYDRDRDLWHGQPVECWNNITHGREYRFYDAINKCTFHGTGLLNGVKFIHYKAIPYELIPEWMFEAYKTLEL